MLQQTRVSMRPANCPFEMLLPDFGFLRGKSLQKLDHNTYDEGHGVGFNQSLELLQKRTPQTNMARQLESVLVVYIKTSYTPSMQGKQEKFLLLPR
jgi:hypothetical protein